MLCASSPPKRGTGMAWRPALTISASIATRRFLAASKSPEAARVLCRRPVRARSCAEAGHAQVSVAFREERVLSRRPPRRGGARLADRLDSCFGGVLMKKLWGVVCVVAVCLAMASFAWGQAQITTGTIQGEVLDEKGLAVPGATVEIRNLDTNFTKTETTGTDGRFTGLSLPPGRYTVTISKQGFATYRPGRGHADRGPVADASGEHE